MREKNWGKNEIIEINVVLKYIKQRKIDKRYKEQTIMKLC